jgi:hypothetical protein
MQLFHYSVAWRAHASENPGWNHRYVGGYHHVTHSNPLLEQGPKLVFCHSAAMPVFPLKFSHSVLVYNSRTVGPIKKVVREIDS